MGAIALAAALLAGANAASAREIAIFPGNGDMDPTILTNEQCTPGKPGDGLRAIVQLRGRGDFESCWHKTDRTPSGLQTINGEKRVIVVCARAYGKRDGFLTNDCRWIDQHYFLDPATVPRSAFD
ncbi:hypothetical protein [Paraburkholderia diazotrophica]|uniref:hypothetical protein n=1 Tax=Paraburkholderia diazotrophica TaxID=667676 RepID=UPI00115FC7B2|nr:hypothetical protein [Paraburkholderia diazotrophica]